MRKPELIVDAHAILGEGPCWDAASGILYWIDIKGRRLHAFDPDSSQDRETRLDKMPGTVACRKSGASLIMAMEDGFNFVDPTTGRATLIVDPEPDRPNNRFNDGKCDPSGRFWAGSMNDVDKARTGAFYRLGRDLSCERMLDGVGTSNGLTWSSDGRIMYYIDTRDARVDAFDFDRDEGLISNRRTAFEVPREIGHPDGMTIDEEGMLWVALWMGWGIGRWDPRTGKLLEKIDIPVARTSCCAFGGPSLDKLYITTASVDVGPEEAAEQPNAGGLFVYEPGLRGASSYSFAG
jgi:sugar lactone lactonase YvrE